MNTLPSLISNIVVWISGILMVIGGVICAIGIIYLLVIWISQNPSFFVWEWLLAFFSAGIGAIVIFIDLIVNIINNFEQFYPSFIISFIGCIVLGLGYLISGI